VPPLRDRRDDIPMLVQHFLARISKESGLPAKPVDPEAMERLISLEWPGNIRELRNTVERLLILASGSRITRGDVERLVGARAGDGGAAIGALEHFDTYESFKLAAERAFLLAKLREHDWNVAETARAIDMPRSNLYKKIERHALARGQG
jgi:two-component system nitrogen regulation response regulator NtrX